MNSRQDERPTAVVGRNTFIHPTVIMEGNDTITIGDDCYVGPWCYLRGKIKIGNECWIGPGVKLHGEGFLGIEDDVGIGSNAVILTTEHNQLQRGVIIRRRMISTPVLLERGCDIGCNATILSGALVGRNVQVGAGAVVTRNSAIHEGIYAGVPAKRIR